MEAACIHVDTGASSLTVPCSLPVGASGCFAEELTLNSEHLDRQIRFDRQHAKRLLVTAQDAQAWLHAQPSVRKAGGARCVALAVGDVRPAGATLQRDRCNAPSSSLDGASPTAFVRWQEGSADAYLETSKPVKNDISIWSLDVIIIHRASN